MAHRIAQAELAENIRARTELLSNQTQELNSYSIAIEEMLRSLNAEISGSGFGAQTASSTTQSAASDQNTTSAGLTSTANNSTIGMGNSQASVSTTATSTHLPRVYASSILPGPLSSLMTTSNYSSSPAAAASTTAPSSAQSAPSTTANTEVQLGDNITGALRSLQASQEDLARIQDQMRSSDDISRDLRQQQQQQQQEQSGSEDSSTEESEEEGETEEPLNDLLPTLSFNELGQSLMDLRSLRSLNHLTSVSMNSSSSSLPVDTVSTSASMDISTIDAFHAGPEEAPVLVVEPDITHGENLTAEGEAAGGEVEGGGVVSSNTAAESEESSSLQEQLPVPQQQAQQQAAQAPTSMFDRLRR